MLHSTTYRLMVGRGLLAIVAVLAAAAACAATNWQEELLKYRAQYEAESDPVRKAKILAKLGPSEMEAVHAYLNDRDEEQALASLERYRDEVRETTDALLATGIDAARRPGGFKELQISLRLSLRRLDDLILSLQQEFRPWFRAVHADIEAKHNLLIDALFPARETKRARGAQPQ